MSTHLHTVGRHAARTAWRRHKVKGLQTGCMFVVHNSKRLKGLSYMQLLCLSLLSYKQRSYKKTFYCHVMLISRFHITEHFLNSQTVRIRLAESYKGTTAKLYHLLFFSLHHFCTSSVTPFPSPREAPFPVPINFIIHPPLKSTGTHTLTDTNTHAQLI